MVLSSLDIYIKSGEAYQTNYTENSNIDNLEITNSDDSYYQKILLYLSKWNESFFQVNEINSDRLQLYPLIIQQ